MTQQTDHIGDTNKMVTAVEWLKDKIKMGTMCDHINGVECWNKETLLEFIEQAKQMEKDQIMDGFMAGKWDWSEHIKDGKESKDPSEYYNELYEKE